MSTIIDNQKKNRFKLNSKTILTRVGRGVHGEDFAESEENEDFMGEIRKKRQYASPLLK